MNKHVFQKQLGIFVQSSSFRITQMIQEDVDS